MPQASPLSRKTMTRDPVFGFGRSREILCVASERTPGRRSRGVPHLPARLASPWRRGWWHPRRPPPRSPPLRPRTPGRWSRATTTTARTWRGASGEKRTIRPRTNPTPASAAPSRRLRVRPTRARAARARARRCVGCARRWSRKGRAKKSELRVLLKKKKNANPRARVSSVCASARPRGATATSGCASASVRRWRSPRNSSSRSLLEEEPLRRSTECSVREPSTRSPRGPRRARTTRRRKRRRKKNLLLVRCFPAFPRVSCFDERRGSRRSRRSRGSANAFASRSLQGGRRRPRRALPPKRSKRTRVERGGGGRRFASRSRERSEFSKPFETASLRGPSFEASWRSPSSPRSRSQRWHAPAWDAPRGASPRARPPPPPPRDPPRGSRLDSRDGSLATRPYRRSIESAYAVPGVTTLFAPARGERRQIVREASWSRGVVESCRKESQKVP